MSDAIVRKQLVGFLHSGNAPLTFDEAITDFPMALINEPFPNCSYSPRGLLEHIRLTQADILDFMTNREYRNKRWPQDSSPAPGTKATEAGWQATLDSFRADADEVERIGLDPATNLYADLPWGN